MKGGSNSSPVGFEQNQEQIGIEHAIFAAFSVNIPEVFIFTIGWEDCMSQGFCIERGDQAISQRNPK